MDELEIFSVALTHTNCDDRLAYLDQACGGDGELRERIEKLLALHANDASMLDRGPAELLAEMQDHAVSVPHGHARSLEPSAFDLKTILTPSPRPEALGRLGHYDVLEVLGQGGFGIVVKAFDDRLHRVVAIKILAPHLSTTSPPRKRFLREARVAAQVKHENVVQIYAVEEQPQPYLAMEFVEGPTLQERLDSTGPLEAAEVVRLGCQIARGLAAAHEKGLIHRDIKPANILLEAGMETRAKLTDFGLARAADDASLTQSGVIGGTPLYMSPEQARGQELDHRTDLFSLGSTLYAMVTGRPPFRASGTLAILKRVAEDAPRPIAQVIDGVPKGLCAVIMRLLEKEPDQRFASAREVVDALTHCLTCPPAPARRARSRPLTYAAMILLMVVPVVIWTANSWRGYFDAQPDQSATNSDRPVALVEPVKPPVVKADFIVTSDQDGGPGSLRDALNQANQRQVPQTIAFAPELAGRTITLVDGWAGPEDRSALVIGQRGDITIDGGMGVALRLTSPVNRRLLQVSGNARLTLKNLTLSGGNVLYQYDGGMIENQGGAVLATDSELVIERCTIHGNQANIGGAISAEFAMVAIRDSTFDGNSAYTEHPLTRQFNGGGGAINFSTWSLPKYTLKITGCTFTNNVGATGGALWTRGEAGQCTVINSTFVGNRSLGGFGGAINNSLPDAILLNLTVVDNSSAGGGALSQYAQPLRLMNSLVANNKAAKGLPADLTVVSGGTISAESCNNLISEPAAETGLADGVNDNRIGLTDDKLGPLTDNGGPTKTIALLPGSPAIDAGDASLLPPEVKTDQRGLPRLKNGKIDLGAYQTQ